MRRAFCVDRAHRVCGDPWTPRLARV